MRGSRPSDRPAGSTNPAPSMSFKSPGRRVSDAPPVPKDMYEGSRGADGNGVILPIVGPSNPGPTDTMRGVEANTMGMHQAGNDMAPMENVYASPNLDGGTIPGGDSLGVRNLPDSSAMNTVSMMEDQRRNADSMAANSMVNPRPHSSYESFGEKYQGNSVTDENPGY